MAQLRAMMIIVLIVGISLASIAVVEGQVNFSPSWGKRTSRSEDISQIAENCKIPIDSVVRIQKLIQLEAQKLLRCESMAGDVQRRKR